METTSKLNLTRKWRSKTFDTIVGQDISVRILKNSLYLDQVFPVYLFSGQRGCGKTTTARVFTAALNCHELEAFRKNPKSVQVPCLQCTSCVAMENGKHPDFTEIDAASHTGVDHVRQLIETTTFMPQMGSKKIYLIDEVHMLSKAAFNALLKILEEPPASVIFILATTDPHKVIDTVKSRCFQLFFGPPQTDLLLKHLQFVCEKEKIEAESAALSILIREAEGSIRDAMNLLEQVRFIEPNVTVTTVSRALGYTSDSELLELLELSLAKSSELPAFLVKINFSSKNTDFVWKRLCELLKMVLYTKHGVVVDASEDILKHLQQIANKFSLSAMVIFLRGMTAQEQILLKTAHKSLSLELFFLQGTAVEVEVAVENENDQVESVVAQKKTEFVENKQDPWQRLLGLVSQCSDPILVSIFKQAKFVAVDSSGLVEIEFSEDYSFFGDLITEKEIVWKNYLQQVFGEEAKLNVRFTPSVDMPKATVEKDTASGAGNSAASGGFTAAPRAAKSSYQSRQIGQGRQMKKQVDVSDKQKWPLANQILEYFPGQVYEVGE